MFKRRQIDALSESELEWIKKNFAETKNDEIKAKFNISHSTLHRIARIYQLRKAPAFMVQMQDNATAAAIEAIKAENYEQKQRRAENARRNATNKFKPGVYALADKTPEQLAEIHRRQGENWKAARKKDIARVMFGLEQRQKFRLPKDFDPRKQRKILSFRYILRQKGYVIDKRGGMGVNVTPETRRSAQIEKTAKKLGFILRI